MTRLEALELTDESAEVGLLPEVEPLLELESPGGGPGGGPEGGADPVPLAAVVEWPEDPS